MQGGFIGSGNSHLGTGGRLDTTDRGSAGQEERPSPRPRGQARPARTRGRVENPQAADTPAGAGSDDRPDDRARPQDPANRCTTAACMFEFIPFIPRESKGFQKRTADLENCSCVPFSGRPGYNVLERRINRL